MTLTGSRTVMINAQDVVLDLAMSYRVNPPQRATHVITDAPYNKRTHTGHALPVRDRQAVSFDPVDPADFVPYLLDCVSGWVVCFCALEQFGAYEAAAGAAWFRAGIWDKINPLPQINGQGPSQGAEGIAIMWAGWHGARRRHRPHWEAGGKPGIWRHPPARGAERMHETPKPVGLCRMLIEDFTLPGERIWDPFAGAMPMGVAAVETGRRYHAAEIRLDYAAIGAARVAEAVEVGPIRLLTPEQRLEGHLESLDHLTAKIGSREATR